MAHGIGFPLLLFSGIVVTAPFAMSSAILSESDV
jgi:hypothetical protein